MIINHKDLDKFPLCLNCGNKLFTQTITMFGSFWACPECGYDDYSKTIKIENIQNKDIKYTENFSIAKPFNNEKYIYESGIRK